MTREEWLRVKHVTAAALDMPSARRAAFVAAACGGDQVFEREVLSLVSSAVTASPLFEAPPFVTPSAAAALTAATEPATRNGERVDAYKIIRGIGRGGMGTVFLAERADAAYHQLVALEIGGLWNRPQ